MSTSITIRISTDLLTRIKKLFPKETQTKAIVETLKRGVLFNRILKNKMISDYSQMDGSEEWTLDERKTAYSDISKEEDFSEYLKFIS